jgi:hypothetical protein
MRYSQLNGILTAHFHEYALSPTTSVGIRLDMPCPLDPYPTIRVRYDFVREGKGWTDMSDLRPAELVKLADIVGMVADWKSGKLDELLPSTSTRLEKYREHRRREEPPHE